MAKLDPLVIDLVVRVTMDPVDPQAGDVVISANGVELARKTVADRGLVTGGVVPIETLRAARAAFNALHECPGRDA